MKVRIEPTKKCQLQLSNSDCQQLSSLEKINANLGEENVIAFDVLFEEKNVGFAMWRKFAPDSYFLWDFAINSDYQSQKIGTTALMQLIEFFKSTIGAKFLTTTYLTGNDRAQHVYEKLGFVTTDTVEDGEVSEVNMCLKL